MNIKAEVLKRRTFAFALEVVRFCRTLRETWEGRELSDQLFRSGTRVGANYRAACRARSHPDFVNKVGVVVEEADETVYWLEIIQASDICKTDTLAPLRVEAGELCAIFTHLTSQHVRMLPLAAAPERQNQAISRSMLESVNRQLH
jgi:four helix bundle protein